MSGLRIIHLPTVWTVLLDIALWYVIHMGVVIVMVSLPVRWFDPEAWPFRIRGFERKGRLYQDLFRVRSWKDLLPDGSNIMAWRSFPKNRIRERGREYLERFARETCRSEVTHVVTMLFAPAFFLWNPVWVGWLMIAYAVAENAPIAVAQRFTRARLLRALSHRAPEGAAAGRRTA